VQVKRVKRGDRGNPMPFPAVSALDMRCALTFTVQLFILSALRMVVSIAPTAGAPASPEGEIP
jgi:hypothetical protein